VDLPFVGSEKRFAKKGGDMKKTAIILIVLLLDDHLPPEMATKGPGGAALVQLEGMER
jgi:hypothetical protein